MKERNSTEPDRIEKVNIDGIGLSYGDVSDLMESVRDLIERDGFHSIEEICMSALEKMEQDGRVYDALKHLDLAVIGDNGILTAAGLSNVRRKLAIDNMHFFKELLFSLEENKKSVFIIGATENSVSRVAAYIRNKHPQLFISGTEIYIPEANTEEEEQENDREKAVNEINSAGPDVILSVLPVPDQEIFLNENHTKISARLWYGLGQERLEARNGIADQLKNSLRIRQLKKRFETGNS